MSPLEYFTLARARADARELGDEGRKALGEKLAAGARDAWTAESLWASGQRANALRFMVRGLRESLAAAELVAPDLASLGVDATVARRAAIVTGIPDGELPELDSEVDETHAHLYDAAQRTVRTLEEVLLPRASSDEALVRAGRMRAAFGVATLVAAVALVAGPSLISPGAVEIDASAYRTADVTETWPPENVFDRDEMTYWHLPEGETGWVELRFPEPRDVRAVRILNGHDLHADDRNRRDRRRFGYASQDIVLHVYSGEREVATVEQTLRPLRTFERTTLEVDAQAVDRIRIDIVSFHGSGGGLAEVEVLP